MTSSTTNRLRVSIIGAGIGGLGAAIAFSALPNISVKVYEQASELREVGAGITVGYNTWKVLELLDDARSLVKGDVKNEILQRNGLTGEILARKAPTQIPPEYEIHRVRRTNLQAALIAKVPKGLIELRKRLIGMENVGDSGVKLTFEDGTEEEVDLVVGGDGIRSIVRQHLYPDYALKFTGTTIWRTLIPAASVAHIPELLPDASWWHGPQGHIFFTAVDPEELLTEQRLLEITANNIVDPSTVKEKRVGWGVPATNEKKYHTIAQKGIQQVPEGNWKEFSTFHGPCLESLTGWGKVALIGDASHPLSGGVGSGASFALEDAWLLARTIDYTRNDADGTAKALKIFNDIRHPYYAKMYIHLSEQKQKLAAAKAAEPEKSFENGLKVRLAAFGRGQELAWINQSDIKNVWERYVESES